MLWSFRIIPLLSARLPGTPHASKFFSDCFLPLVSPSYQGEEQEVQLYYKEFSSTRHGFLGASVVSQPLSQVWAAVSDPTLWPLYHKPIQTARLHQRVTNSISLGESKGLKASKGLAGSQEVEGQSSTVGNSRLLSKTARDPVME